MITCKKNGYGAWVVTALVSDRFTPFTWFESKQFYDYTKSEAIALFREYLTNNRMTIEKD
jgi:hypothetical protein